MGLILVFHHTVWQFLLGWWPEGKESDCNAGDPSSSPGLGRSPGEGKGYPLQYSGLENSMDCIVYGVAKIKHEWATFTFIIIQYYATVLVISVIEDKKRDKFFLERDKASHICRQYYNLPRNSKNTHFPAVYQLGDYCIMNLTDSDDTKHSEVWAILGYKIKRCSFKCRRRQRGK